MVYRSSIHHNRVFLSLNLKAPDRIKHFVNRLTELIKLSNSNLLKRETCFKQRFGSFAVSFALFQINLKTPIMVLLLRIYKFRDIDRRDRGNPCRKNRQQALYDPWITWH